jgi:hypothetical protein
MPKRSSASPGTASSKWPDATGLIHRLIVFLILLQSFVGYAQPKVIFEQLNKAPALVGTAFGGALTRRSIIVRDWLDYHLYSFETDSWEKIQFTDQRTKKLSSEGWITCAYLPSFGKVITMGDEIEVLDLQKLQVQYYPIEGTAPVPGGVVVWKEKVYLLGSSLVIDLSDLGIDDSLKNRRASLAPRRVVVPTSYFLVFDPATLRFDALDTLPGPHFRLGAFAGDHLFAFGPKGQPTPVTDVIRYDPVLNEWDSVTQLPVSVGAVVEQNGFLYLLGLHRAEGFLIRMNAATGEWTQFRTNVPWTHGLAYLRNNRIYYLAGMKKNPQIRDVFFRHPRWLDRKMYVLDLEKLPP